jgi:CO/xanthine dehydrogenase FAD-binding subunit
LTTASAGKIICTQTNPGVERVYTRPADFTEAFRLLAEPDARVLAGGTDLFPAAGERPLMGRCVDITALPGLRTIETEGGQVRIGAAVTWSDFVRADLPPGLEALKAAAREVGGVQIQNRGTIAGNLCNASPAADGVPPLLILDAEVELASLRGRRRLRLDAFIAGNRRTAREHDEIMTAIVVPQPPSTARSSFLKLGARRYLVISIAMVAILLDVVDERVRDARIAVGACSAAAMRLPGIERRLVGMAARAGIGDHIHDVDLAGLTPIDDLRGTADYRRDAALTLVRRAVECCLHGEPGGVV